MALCFVTPASEMGDLRIDSIIGVGTSELPVEWPMAEELRVRISPRL
jgi:hypothetical protein